MISGEGKVGSKGELFPPKYIRVELGFQPNTKVEYIVTSNGYLLVKKIYSITELLQQPTIKKFSQQEIESTSEEMQKKGIDF